MMFLKNVELKITDGIAKITKGIVISIDPKDVMLAKGGGGGSSTQTVYQNVDPWGPQQSHLKEVMSQARRNWKTVPSYVDFSPQTESALQMTEERARAGSPVTRAMQQQLEGTLGGDYLYGGKGFNAAVEAAQRQVLPQVQSQFARGGRTGSGLAATAQTQALSDAFAKQYGQERQNQMRSMLFAPQAAQADYDDFAKLAAVGSQREGMELAKISDPQERLKRYYQLVAGPYGSASTGTQAVPGGGGFSGLGTLGGGLGGAYLASMIGGSTLGPVGMGLGALGGGLLGGFL